MPYCVGLESAANALFSAGLPTLLVLAGAIFLVIVIYLSVLQSEPADAATPLPCFSLFTIVPFFRRRHDFLNWGFYAAGQSIFQFNLLGNPVVVVSGESARQAFFSAKGLDLTEGFKMLSGAIPMIPGVTSDLHTKRVALIHKRLAAAQRNAHLNDLIPQILEDTKRVMQSWGKAGKFDPFEKIYELLFQTTIRSISCSEIADDPVLVARLKRLYDTLDMGTTPLTVLMPWLPSPAMIKKLWATKKIYDIVTAAINCREQSGISRNDTLQMLLDSGDEKLVIIGFTMGLIIAGARATGTTASWLMTLLGSHSAWRERAASEVDALLEHNVYAGLSTTPESLSSRLASIPLDVWESETPVLDALIKETTRLAQPHTAMRRNVGPPMYLEGKIIPTGTYVVYPFSDVHLDEKLYPDPWKFDPGRPTPKAPLAYVGWGGGKTLCLGTRLAKLELKLVTAMLVLGFRHKTVDGSGQLFEPTPNWNDIFLCRPPLNETAFLQFERSDMPL